MGAFQYGHQAFFAPVNASATSDNLIVTGVTGQSIRVINVVVQASGTVLTTWKTGLGASGVAMSGQMPQVANTGYAPPEAAYGHFQCTSGDGLNLHLSAAVPVQGWVVYQLV